MENNTSSFDRLPLELRNTIYEYVIGDITTLTISKSPISTCAIQRFYKNLPPCLYLNQQILLEATRAFLHRCTSTLHELTLSQPSDLLLAIPSEARFTNLQRLVFTHPQSHYSKPPMSAQSIVQRCPNLKHLTLRLRASLLLSDDYASDLAPIFTHKILLDVHIKCANAPRFNCSYLSAPDATRFEPFDKWWTEKGGGIGLSIDLSPDKQVNADPQCSERKVGRMRWIEVADWFG